MLEAPCEKAKTNRGEHTEPEQILPSSFIFGTQPHLENASREVKQNPKARCDERTLLAEHAVIHRASNETDAAIAGQRRAMLDGKAHGGLRSNEELGRGDERVHDNPSSAIERLRIASKRRPGSTSEFSRLGEIIKIRKLMRKFFLTVTLVTAFASVGNAQTTGATPMDHSQMDHAAHMKAMEQAHRQAQVAERGKNVMPFKLAATRHFFKKTADGGVQQVVTKRSSDSEQVRLARSHLREIRKRFLKGDFSAPSQIHGQEMPGLAELQAARPGQISIDYKNIRGGGQLTYQSKDTALVDALHKWFDAQLSDHGSDAMEGHAHHGLSHKH
jgi:hypothetical protein